MANIIRNAYNAIRDRHGENTSAGKLRVRTRVRGEWLYIHIQDNGCGIERRENGFEYIFEPGYSSRKAKRHSSGQGLTDCKAIITAHGGKIRVFSQVNHGTTFTITLPIKFER
jgi:signal transduction histidine kinase